MLIDTRQYAIISPCGLYRYVLTRSAGSTKAFFADGHTVNFIMLNPSTADAEQDDPTIRRCIGYAHDWGYTDIVVTNLFALRSTDPAGLLNRTDHVGPENDRHILGQARRADTVVCAWGTDGVLGGRSDAVRRMLTDAGIKLHCLKLTKGGQPGHPLYLPKGLVPQMWETN